MAGWIDGLPPRVPIALLIDAENIRGDRLTQIVTRAHALRAPTIVRAFADWTDPAMAATSRLLAPLGIDARHNPAVSGRKNGSDIALAVDAMDLLHAIAPRCFLIGSCDGDFTALAVRLRAAGCEVIGIGVGAISESFGRACTSYHALGEGPAKARPTPRVPPLSLEQIAARLVQHARAHANAEGWCPLGELGKIAAQDPELDYKKAGFTKLRRMIETTGCFQIEVAADGTTVFVAPLVEETPQAVAG